MGPIPKECQSEEVEVWSEEQRWPFWLERKQGLLENAPMQIYGDSKS